MAPISLDLRQRIFEARQAGETTSDVAERFAVSPAFVRRLMQVHRQTGSLLPKSGPRGFKPRLDEQADRLRELVARHPDLHPREIRDRLDLKVAAITVWRALVRLGLTFKKSRCALPNKTAPTSPSPAKPGRRRLPTTRPNA